MKTILKTGPDKESSIDKVSCVLTSNNACIDRMEAGMTEEDIIVVEKTPDVLLMMSVDQQTRDENTGQDDDDVVGDEASDVVEECTEDGRKAERLGDDADCVQLNCEGENSSISTKREFCVRSDWVYLYVVWFMFSSTLYLYVYYFVPPGLPGR